MTKRTTINCAYCNRAFKYEHSRQRHEQLDCRAANSPAYETARMKRLDSSLSPRTAAVELELLERYHSIRSLAGHDYGCGQRGAELSTLRRELFSRLGEDGYLELREHPATDDELRNAFDRIARPRIARIYREDYRRSTPATRRTLASWGVLERMVAA
jgi:hypothetical protein